jgi:hypothetical protein
MLLAENSYSYSLGRGILYTDSSMGDSKPEFNIVVISYLITGT